MCGGDYDEDRDEVEEYSKAEVEEYGDVHLKNKDALVCVACDGYVIGGRMYIKDLQVEVVETPPGADKMKKISITFLTGGT